MNKQSLLETVKLLNLTTGQHVIFGGACMVVHGIRSSEDIDIYVSKTLFEQLRARDWQEEAHLDGEPFLTKTFKGIQVEAFESLGGGGWHPPNRYFEHAEMIEGHPFMPLEDLLAWKVAVKRPKDIVDIELINSYLEKSLCK